MLIRFVVHFCVKNLSPGLHPLLPAAGPLVRKYHILCRVPKDLARRIRDFYSYMLDKRVDSDETDIISGLNPGMRSELVLFLYKETVEKVPFFKNKHS